MRLIDADALKERAIRVSTVKEHCYMKAVGTHEIDKAPTIDAVEVVRCKDCIHHKESVFAGDGNIYCNKKRCYFPNDGFCNFGERRCEE